MKETINVDMNKDMVDYIKNIPLDFAKTHINDDIFTDEIIVGFLMLTGFQYQIDNKVKETILNIHSIGKLFGSMPRLNYIGFKNKESIVKHFIKDLKHRKVITVKTGNHIHKKHIRYFKKFTKELNSHKHTYKLDKDWVLKIIEIAKLQCYIGK